MLQKEKPIAIYYEHPEWFRPLFAELERRKLSYLPIDASSHKFNPGKTEDYAVFFNRMSPSAYLRGHENGIFYTQALLAHLKHQGLRVINGYDAFLVETSKSVQLSILESLGIAYPRTRVINSAEQSLEAAKDLRFPVVVKANIGGSGAGIVRFNSLDALEKTVSENLVNLGIDNTALVQEFSPARGGHITRIETLGGKFLYAIKVYTNGENFNLCPADLCQTEDNQTNDDIAALGDVCLTEPWKNGLTVEKYTPPAEIIEAVERIVAAAQIDVGGVEYLIDDRDGQPLFYDINTLSNFVADAVNIVGFDPHEKLVDFLEQEVELSAAAADFQLSAVG
jgi:glutathione synthase/RimK-type ligase-like ATP-grasp enzyme